MRIRSRTPLAALAAIALAGCGGPEVELGSGVGGSTPGGPYEQAGAEICTQVAERFAEIQAEPPRTFSQGGEIVSALLAVAEDGEQQLASVEPPAEKADAFDAYREARGEVIAQLERAADAAEAEDGDAYERARQAVVEGAGERARLARRAGLAVCARVEEGRS